MDPHRDQRQVTRTRAAAGIFQIGDPDISWRIRKGDPVVLGLPVGIHAAGRNSSRARCLFRNNPHRRPGARRGRTRYCDRTAHRAGQSCRTGKGQLIGLKGPVIVVVDINFDDPRVIRSVTTGRADGNGNRLAHRQVGRRHGRIVGIARDSWHWSGRDSKDCSGLPR